MTLKKLFAGLISLAAALLAVSAITVCVGAETYVSGDYQYSVLDDGTVRISEYNGSATNLTIPSTLDGKKVTSIGLCAFRDCSKLTSIKIPDGVNCIDDYSFENCSSLTSITIPDSVTSIGDWAFTDCSSLKSITIPKSVTSIGCSAFSDCKSLTSINIPDSISSIGRSAFDYTPFLNNQTTTVKYAGKWVVYCDMSTATAEIKSSTIGIADGAFERCASLESIIIPDGVTSIGHSAFSECSSLASVTIPDSVTSIESGAFSGTPFLDNQTSTVKYAGKWAIYCDHNATTATIKSGTVGIADRAFGLCKNLTSINIPNSVISVGEYAFVSSSITSITIPDSVASIGNSAFSGCSKLTSITVGKNNQIYSSSDGALLNKPMTEIIICPEGKKGEYVIPDSVKTIKQGAFYGCLGLTSVTIPYGVTSIGGQAFSNCERLTKINIPDSVTSIAHDAFYNCHNLNSIVIPDSVTSIGKYAFSDCWNLASISIPDSVKFIGYGAFQDCSRLKDVYYTGSKSQWDKIDIGTENEDLLNATIHYNYSGVSSPSSVTGLNIKGRAADALRLAWNKNTSADGYIIEMKDGSKWARVAKIAKNTTTEYRIAKLAAGTAYSFRVKAYKMDGKTALYSGYTTISARTNPSATSGLKLKGRAGDALRISWTKNTTADGYIIEMKSGNSWTRVGKITKNSTVEFKKSKLKAGTAYTFRVKAYKMSGNTALYSATKTISVRTNPSAVSGLKLKNSAKDAVRLSWTKNTSADGYIIEMKSGSTWTRVGKVTKNSTVEFRKGSLKSKTSYSFRIKAYKMSGKTALYGATKTITVKTK